MLAWASYGALWELDHKVIFDGVNKLIYVDPSISTINFKEDVYSPWKEWVLLYDNSKFLSALRTTGGDPIGGGQYTGDYYFLINGWRMVIDHALSVNGNVFSDDYDSPFVAQGDTALVQNKVAAISIAVDGGGGTSSGSSNVAVGENPPSNPQSGDLWWNSVTGLLMIYYDNGSSPQWVTASPLGAGGDTGTYPSVEEIRQEIDTNSVALAAISSTTQATSTTVSQINTRTQQIQTAVNELPTQTDDIKTVVDSILIMVDEILKYDRNRTKIDKSAKTLTVYDDDGVTPLRVFNLLDGSGISSVAEVLERSPT